MPTQVSSSPKRTCFVLWLVFSFVFLSNTVVTPFTGLRVRASSDPAYADVNGDGAVDVLDVVTAAIAFGSDLEHPRWDSRVDLNNDDCVDILDLVLILSNFSNSDSMHARMMQVEAFQFWNVHPSQYPAICDLYKDMGVTVVRTSSLLGSLGWFPSEIAPVTYGEALLEFQKALHDRGIKHYSMVLGLYSWDDFDYGHQTGGFCSQVINNVNGLGDVWIEKSNEYIDTIQPDVWAVCNEFYRNQADLDIDVYIAFVKRCVQAHRQVKPDLTFVVGGAPFWDLKPLINKGGLDEPNLLYSVHRYYQHRGDYPPSHDDMSLAYWHATTSEGLAYAKEQLINDFDNKRGVALALSKGFKIHFEEIGTHWTNPNYMQYMKDALDYCVERNLDFGIWMPTLPGASFRTNVLSADLTALNEVGYLAREYMT